MYRKKDFILMDVVNIEGKKLGYINDILIDCNLHEVKGFVVNPYKLFKRRICIFKEDVIYFGHRIIVKKSDECRNIAFNDIKNMDVIDLNGGIIGIIEDIVFCEKNFKIKAIIISCGLIKSFFYGKRIISVENIIFGEKNVLFYANNSYEFYSLPHKLLAEVDEYEQK